MIGGMMKTTLNVLFGVAIALCGTSAMADDLDKLHALQQAITAPAEGVAIVKKPRTRAIVFDAKPDAQEPAVNAAPVALNCSALPADTKSTAIDFTIEFKLGSAQIAPSSEKILREISKVLALSDKCVLIEGHTDAIGNADKNMQLSRERADSVVEFISEKAGLNKKRLVPVGKGSSEPLQNLDPRNPHNRRVVFKVAG
jgi:outer membrane protein OmpA-like peptidoglycan-associated protein